MAVPKLRFKDDNREDYPAWTNERLGNICSNFKSGRSIVSSEIHDTGEYPVYGGNGLRGFCNKFTHNGEYVLIGRQGALCGNINHIIGKTYVSEHAIAVQGSNIALTMWLKYKLYAMNLNRYSESSAQPGLSVEKLIRLKVNLPCLNEQQKSPPSYPPTIRNSKLKRKFSPTFN